MAWRGEDRRIGRRLHHDAVARRQEGLERHVEARLDARQEDEGIGRHRPAISLAKVPDERLTQRVLRNAIAEHRMVEPLADRRHDLVRHGKVHVRDPERQHVGWVAAPFRAARAVPIERAVEVVA